MTKNESLSKGEQMQDSLQRIKKLQKEVWAVKLADRITNLQPALSHWDEMKKVKYKDEARVILNELQDGNDFLARRLNASIEVYNKICEKHLRGVSITPANNNIQNAG